MTAKPTILVVGRNVTFRVGIMEMIYAKFRSVRLLDSDNAEEALDLVRSHHLDLVLLDVQLNGKDGLRLTEKIHNENPDVTIAVFTNDDFPEYKEAAQRSGADYFFSRSAPSGRKILEMIESELSAMQYHS
jgi:two-component system invasion response regulator UvrY